MRWIRFWQRRKRSEDFVEELDAYLVHEIDDNLARGMTPNEARHAALRKFGNRTVIKEEIHLMNSVNSLESVWQDLRYASRMLRAKPAFTAVAVLSLALGIGANLALFQLVDALLLRSLPVKAPQQLITLVDHSGHFSDPPNGYTYPQWEEIRANHKPFTEVLAWGTTHFNMAKSGDVRNVDAIFVSGSFFQTLGVSALMGRIFTPADDHRGCGIAGAVIGYGFWQQEYGGSWPRYQSEWASVSDHRSHSAGILRDRSRQTVRCGRSALLTARFSAMAASWTAAMSGGSV